MKRRQNPNNLLQNPNNHKQMKNVLIMLKVIPTIGESFIIPNLV